MDALAASENEVFVSAATAWELAIKCALGKLRFPVERFAEIVTQAGFASLVIEPRHAIAAARLPPHHHDPFDRMLVAQARVERLVLVSFDAAMAAYDVPLLSSANP